MAMPIYDRPLGNEYGHGALGNSQQYTQGNALFFSEQEQWLMQRDALSGRMVGAIYNPPHIVPPPKQEIKHPDAIPPKPLFKKGRGYNLRDDKHLLNIE